MKGSGPCQSWVLYHGKCHRVYKYVQRSMDGDTPRVTSLPPSVDWVYPIRGFIPMVQATTSMNMWEAPSVCSPPSPLSIHLAHPTQWIFHLESDNCIDEYLQRSMDRVLHELRCNIFFHQLFSKRSARLPDSKVGGRSRPEIFYLFFLHVLRIYTTLWVMTDNLVFLRLFPSLAKTSFSTPFLANRKKDAASISYIHT